MKNDYETIGNNSNGVYQQFIGYRQINGSSVNGLTPLTSCTTENGMFTYIVVDGGSILTGTYIQTLKKDLNTGMYVEKQMLTQGVGGTLENQGLCVLGGYLYSFFDGGSNMACARYTIGIDGTLSAETLMTIPTISLPSSQQVWAWTNGTNVFASVSTSTCYQFSISGTTLTNVGNSFTSVCPTDSSKFLDFSGNQLYNGDIYVIRGGVLLKLNDDYGATTTTNQSVNSIFPIANGNETSSATSDATSIVSIISDNVFYYGNSRGFDNGSGDISFTLCLTPITKTI